MNIAFTGTQQGMNEAQLLTLAGLIPSRSIFRHGDCIGADAQAHTLAVLAKCKIYIHPCTIEDKRAHCVSGNVTIYSARAPLRRNADIVEETDWLIAAPAQDTEQLRSGTWSTIRYARKYRETYHGAYRITQIKRDGTTVEL